MESEFESGNAQPHVAKRVWGAKRGILAPLLRAVLPNMDAHELGLLRDHIRTDCFSLTMQLPVGGPLAEQHRFHWQPGSKYCHRILFVEGCVVDFAAGPPPARLNLTNASIQLHLGTPPEAGEVEHRWEPGVGAPTGVPISEQTLPFQPIAGHMIAEDAGPVTAIRAAVDAQLSAVRAAELVFEATFTLPANPATVDMVLNVAYVQKPDGARPGR